MFEPYFPGIRRLIYRQFDCRASGWGGIREGWTEMEERDVTGDFLEFGVGVVWLFPRVHLFRYFGTRTLPMKESQPAPQAPRVFRCAECSALRSASFAPTAEPHHDEVASGGLCQAITPFKLRFGY